jgi:type I restriction enzyme, S subunit
VREIDLIREYRTRLIADIVTGKLDVRGTELPELDEAEAPEDWDEDADVEAEDITDIEGAVDADE